MTPKQVIVADPAIGQQTLSHREFQAGWTGYALLLQPTAQLKETKEDTTNFWQFFELAKPHSMVLLEAGTTSFSSRAAFFPAGINSNSVFAADFP